MDTLKTLLRSLHSIQRLTRIRNLHVCNQDWQAMAKRTQRVFLILR